MTRLVIFVVASAATVGAIAAVIQVPGDVPTIQEAIDLAVDGDSILVAPGTYVENINFMGKAITLESTDGAAVTTIDGSFSDSVVTFENGEDENTVIDGFTITNGEAGSGAGILCIDAFPTILNNTISGNVTTGFGAGIAICAYTVSNLGTIANNTISGNTAGGGGGGLYAYLYAPTVPEIDGNRFVNNTSDDLGGGAFVSFYASGSTGPLSITNNTVSGNTALFGGGGIATYSYSDIVFTNNLVVDNQATFYGFGGGANLFAYYGIVSVDGSTLANNTADLGGGLILYSYPSPAVLENSIVWGNTATTSPQIDTSGYPIVSSYSDIQGGGFPGPGTIDADPLFVTGPDSDYFLSQVLAGQAAESPAVDAGDPASPVPAGTTRTDLVADSAPRDMGFHLVPGSGSGPQLRRGDANGDTAFDISDAIFSLAALFTMGAPAPGCADAADSNDDGGFDISDAIFTLAALFTPGAPAPPAPGSMVCGVDPTPDAIDCATTPCP